MAENDSLRIQGLAKRASQGDPDAFSDIVKALMNDVMALTYKMTGDRETARDLTQESFIAAWENIASFRAESRFETWLYRIAVNKALGLLQKKKAVSIEDVDQSLEQSGETPDENLSRAELRGLILEFMQRLPEQQRLAFELRFYRQLSFEEIAEVTGKALGTVKTNYRESIKKLREFADEKGLRP